MFWVGSPALRDPSKIQMFPDKYCGLTYSNLMHWYITLTYSTMFRLKHVAIIGQHTKGGNMPIYITQNILEWHSQFYTDIYQCNILIHVLRTLQITWWAFITTENL